MKNIDLKQLAKKVFKYLIITLLIWFVKVFMFGNVNAQSNVYFSKSVSSIGGKNFGNADNWVGLPANTTTDYAINLTFSYDYQSGYENTIPYQKGDKINLLLTSCVANDHKITNVYPYTKNYLGVSYISNEYCGFNWESPNNHVQYTLLQLNVSDTYDDDVESSTGTILIKHFVVNNINLAIYNNNSWADAIYFINIQVLDNNDYATLLNQYKQSTSVDKTNEQLKDTNDFLKDNTDPNVDVSSLGTVSGLLPAGPVDSLLNIPFKFLSVLSSSVSSACVPVSTNWVFNTTLNIPCFSEQFYSEVPTALMTFLQVVPCAFILIKYFKHLYKKVDRAVTMNTTADDEWGVI